MRLFNFFFLLYLNVSQDCYCQMEGKLNSGILHFCSTLLLHRLKVLLRRLKVRTLKFLIFVLSTLVLIFSVLGSLLVLEYLLLLTYINIAVLETNLF